MNKYDNVEKRMSGNNQSEENFIAYLEKRQYNYHQIGFQKQPTQDEWKRLPYIMRYTPDFVVWQNNVPKFYEVKSAKNGTFLFIDTKKIIKPWAQLFKCVKINDLEFDRTLRWVGDTFMDHCKNLVVTQGESGANLFHNKKCKSYPTKPVVINDVSGAGDTFFAGLVCEYLKSNSLDRAIKFANECARAAVQKPNVAFVTAEDLNGYNME